MNLNHNQKVTDAGLANFTDCKNLTDINLYETRHVSDAGLAHFKDCKNLTTIILDSTQVSDAGLAHFKDCKNLTQHRGFNYFPNTGRRYRIGYGGDVPGGWAMAIEGYSPDVEREMKTLYPIFRKSRIQFVELAFQCYCQMLR